MESTGKRVKGGQFELLLLLLFKYIGSALGMGGGKCMAGPVRGMAGERKEAGQDQRRGGRVDNM